MAEEAISRWQWDKIITLAVIVLGGAITFGTWKGSYDSRLESIETKVTEIRSILQSKQDDIQQISKNQLEVLRTLNAMLLSGSDVGALREQLKKKQATMEQEGQ